MSESCDFTVSESVCPRSVSHVCPRSVLSLRVM